jgi:Asp-tRNA(Asn)/Glu-tRNA(Gln) amidotransferase A subunit family amidase
MFLWQFITGLGEIGLLRGRAMITIDAAALISDPDVAGSRAPRGAFWTNCPETRRRVNLVYVIIPQYIMGHNVPALKGPRMRPPLFALTAALLILAVGGCGEEIRDTSPVVQRQIQAAEALFGLEMTPGERDLMMEDLTDQRDSYAALRQNIPGNSLQPALRFDPQLAWAEKPSGNRTPPTPGDDLAIWGDPGPVARPAHLESLAFANLSQLGKLIRQRQVSCLELTELALARLEKYGPELECVITLTAERARDRARDLDRMLDRGEYLGPLHGIPYGAKDLLAVKGAPTTWGAAPYQDQVIDETATVVRKLDQAGAVLVAKLTLGALAWGDVWYGGKTRNPWNLEEGSSGSSAGPASAVAAGLVPFAIGTETWGSIVSPSTRCGVTGLRPTFGRVSRAGAMALSWSMDKIGPIARSVGDCALVFDAIRGTDGRDPTTVDLPFPYRHDQTLAGLRIGYLKSAFDEDYPGHELDQEVLRTLRYQGVDLVPIEFPLEQMGINPSDLAFILSAEAGAAFQDLTLSGRDDELVQQVRYAWPNVFRTSQFIPAVEYIQANRHRTRLMGMMVDVFREVDVYLTPSLSGDSLLITNLTGHPQVVVPAGFTDEDSPHSISFVGRLYDEATLLTVARAYQERTSWHKKTPPGF